MKRFAFALSCALLLAGNGCCWMQPYGCGYGGGTYAPMGGGCPNGACGAGYAPMGGYNGAYAPMGGTAYNPYMTTATLDPMPVY